ncbi:MAG TPA: SdrD B-like domain-containing protein [Thermoanaerobaculia bacterium]|nr:SdrD B-like domain-containing protein [Thermoanaerobaculia bacterium]
MSHSNQSPIVASPSHQCNSRSRSTRRENGFRKISFSAIALVSVIGFLLFLGTARAQQGTGPFASFPSQSVVDARFLTFGCSGSETMDQGTQIALAAPAATTTFDLNVFDGDTARVDAYSKRHWDGGNRQLKFSLYGDPLRLGSTAPENLIGEWLGNETNATSGSLWTASSAAMPDNDWWAVTVTTSAIAQAPSGNYFYNFVIETDGDCEENEQLESNLKIAASDPITFQIHRFSLVGEICQSMDDDPLAGPGLAAAAPLTGSSAPVAVTYDGTFELFLSLPADETELPLFDGDFDFGTDTLAGNPSEFELDACVDEDDPDTDSTYAGFPFATPGANPEGAQGPGSPPDDNPLDDLRRGELGDPNAVGCVRYEVTDPESHTYFNDNPSGNSEWEQFLIASSASTFAEAADHVYDGATLPSGIWTVKIIGLDVSNPSFWDAETCSTRPAREPMPEEDPNDVPRAAACPEVSTYLVGNFVWTDTNKSGTRSSGEAGIAGVLMELVRPSDGAVIATARTGDPTSPNWGACKAKHVGADTTGLSCFGIDAPGKYEVRIAASNFGPGQPLAGTISTTGGPSSTHSLTTANSVNDGFGYVKPELDPPTTKSQANH